MFALPQRSQAIDGSGWSEGRGVDVTTGDDEVVGLLEEETSCGGGALGLLEPPVVVAIDGGS